MSSSISEDKQQRIAIGRISVTGRSREGNYSAGITIPAHILRANKWRLGDNVVISIIKDKAGRRCILLSKIEFERPQIGRQNKRAGIGVDSHRRGPYKPRRLKRETCKVIMMERKNKKMSIPARAMKTQVNSHIPEYDVTEPVCVTNSSTEEFIAAMKLIGTPIAKKNVSIG
jgi:hypothetical protein